MADIFDRVKLDVFDQVELDTEDKVVHSKEMADLVQEQLRREIANLPFGKLIADVVRKEVGKQRNDIKNLVSTEIGKARSATENEFGKIRTDLASQAQTAKSQYDELKTNIFNQRIFEFGGFSPQVNDLVIGDPAAEGSWRIVKSGSNLSVQRLESGTWTEKGSFVP